MKILILLATIAGAQLTAGQPSDLVALNPAAPNFVTTFDASSGTVIFNETIPTYGQMTAVSSKEPDDHSYSHRGSEEVYGIGADHKNP